MTSISQALALYDTASQIQRLRFRLSTLSPAPDIPPVSEVSAQVRTLAGIATAVSDEVGFRMDGPTLSTAEKQAIEAYSDALDPLGEAITELGRAQAETAIFNFTTHPTYRDSPEELSLQRQKANEDITGYCEAADGALKTAVGVLQEAATALAPPSTRVSAAARARSPRALGAGQPRPAPAAPAPPSGRARR